MECVLSTYAEMLNVRICVYLCVYSMYIFFKNSCSASAVYPMKHSRIFSRSRPVAVMYKADHRWWFSLMCVLPKKGIKLSSLQALVQVCIHFFLNCSFNLLKLKPLVYI